MLAIVCQSRGSQALKWAPHIFDREKFLPQEGHTTPTCPGKCVARWQLSLFPLSVVEKVHAPIRQNLAAPAGCLGCLAGGSACRYAVRRWWLMGSSLVNRETEKGDLRWDVPGSGLWCHQWSWYPLVRRGNQLGVDWLPRLDADRLNRLRFDRSGQCVWNRL